MTTMTYYAKLKQNKNLQNAEHVFQRVFEENDKRVTIQGNEGAFTSRAGSRAYFTCSPETMHKIAKTGNYHEVIRTSQPRRLYFDIDLKRELIAPLRNNAEFIRWVGFSNIIEDEDVADSLAQAFEFDIRELCHQLGAELPADIVYYTRHRADKFSYHLVVKNVCVANYMQQQRFNCMLETLFGQPAFIYEQGIIDRMDKKTGHFAIPTSFNKGYQLTERYVEYIDKSRDFLVTAFSPRFVHQLPKLAHILTQAEQIKNNNVTDELTEKCKALFTEHMPQESQNHSFKDIKGNVMNFRRTASSYCDICERQHDKDNTFYLLPLDCPDGKILMRGCAKAKGKLKRVCVIEPLGKEKTQSQALLEYVVKNLRYDKASQLASKALADRNPKATYEQYNSLTMKPLTVSEADQCIILKANMGIGKTRAVIEYLRKAKPERVGYVSFRKTLTANILHRFNAEGLDFQSYLDLERDITVPRWICQLESLPRIRYEALPDVLIIDEITQVMKQLFSSMNMTRQAEVYNRFRNIIRRAKHVIVLDADVDLITIEQLNMMFGEHVTMRVIENTAIRPYDVEVTACEATLRKDITRKLTRGKKLVICSNFGHKFNLALKQHCENEKFVAPAENYKKPNVLLLTRETMKDKAVQKTLENVNESWAEFDVIIYSPTVQSGVSFEKIHFDECYGFFNSDTNTFSDCSQMLHRVRQLTGQYHVYLKGGNKCYPVAKNEIEEFLRLNYEMVVPQMLAREEILDEQKKTFTLQYAQTDCYNMYVIYLQQVFDSRANFIKRFVAHELSMGASITVMKTLSKPDKAYEGKRFAKHKSTAADLEIAEIIAEPENEPDSRKAALRFHYGYDGEINETWLKSYNDPITKEVFRNLRDIRHGLDALQAREQRKQKQAMQNTNLKEVIATVDFRYPKHKMINELLEMIKPGYDIMKGGRFKVSREDFENSIIPRVHEWAHANKKFMRMAFNKRPPSAEVSKWQFQYAVKWIHGLLYEFYGIYLSTDRDAKAKQAATKVVFNSVYINKFILQNRDETKPLLVYFDDLNDYLEMEQFFPKPENDEISDAEAE